MNFLQPWMLVALPLVALPIIIHLINQRRFQTIRWGAMMFLLAAQKMSRGYSRIRQWLIMLFRMLAIAGLIFAISRPLSSGRLGQAGGGIADATLILLDRSASMQQLGAGSALSKLETSRGQLVQMLELTRSAKWVLIESTENQPKEIESPKALAQLTTTEPTSAAADIPKMLEAARDYIQSNQLGRTEIWICSDLRGNDWSPESGRWGVLRESLQKMPQGVRIHLLAYSQEAPENFSLRVTDVQREAGEREALLVSLKVTRAGNAGGPVTIPIEFEIGGARSVVQVEIQGPEFEMKNHRIALEQHQERGWGRVSIPADVNPADNTFYLAFGPAPERRALVVAEDETAGEVLKLVAEIPPEGKVACRADVVGIEQLSTVEWEKIGTVLWQARLPQGDETEELQKFVARGGTVICFPPSSPTKESFAGMRWEGWGDSPKEIKVETWRGDEDVLANTQNGKALPVGELSVRRVCALVSDENVAPIPLATLSGGKPLISRVPTDRGGIYFCATTPSTENSTLLSNGVVLYVMIQRALASGAETLKTIRVQDAGAKPGEEWLNWERLAGGEKSIPSEFPFQAGVYSSPDERLYVVNRPAAEDEIAVVDEGTLQGLFAGLAFSRVDDSAGNLNALIQEIWRIFMATMIVALVVESALSLPRNEARKESAARGVAFEVGGNR